MEQTYTAKTLWQDFAPDAEPLDVNVLRVTEQNNVITKKLFFTGRTFGVRKSRVLAVVCRPANKTATKAVLVVGDYSKPIDTAVLQDIAARGKIAIAIDFAGRNNCELCTLYPFDVDYCNADVARDKFYVGESAKQTKLYEYALNSMRAVTYLIQEEKARKVSIVTVFNGSYVGLMVLGTDKRISRGVILFGNLNINYRGVVQSDYNVEHLDEEQLNEHVEEKEKAQKWGLALSPQAYASQIDVPLYVINSANSARVDVAKVNGMYFRINDDSRMLILPHTIDFLPSRYTDGVINWLDGDKIPRETEITSFYDENGDYCLKVKAPKDTTNVSFWYCSNADSYAKHWVKAQSTQEDNCYIAKLDLYEKECKVSAFAVLDGAVSVSTTILEEQVTVKNVKMFNNIIFSGNGKQQLISIKNDHWWNVDSYGSLEKGYLDIVGMKGKWLATFALSDKSVRRKNQSLTFSFDVASDTKQTLSVFAVCRFGKDNESYRQQVELVGDGKWKRVTVDEGKLRRVPDGKSLSDNEVVELIIIHAEDDFIVNNICLI